MGTYGFSLLRRFATAAVLALGFGTAWSALTLWLGTTLIGSGIGEEVPRTETIRVASDGTPMIESYPINDYSRRFLRDLEGRELPDEPSGGMIQFLYLSGEPRPWPAALAGLRWTERIRPFLDEQAPEAVWYFVLDESRDGTGAFVGYERVSNRVIGHIGLAGYRPGPIPAGERIPAASQETYSLQWSSQPASIYSLPAAPVRLGPGDVPPRLVHIPAGNTLRVVDLGLRTVRTAFESPEAIESVAVPYLNAYFGPTGEKDRPASRAILVRTRGRLLRLDHAYNVIGEFAIPPEVPAEAALSWYEVRDGSAVVTFDPPMPDAAAYDYRKRRVMVYQVAADGVIRKATSVDLSNGSYVSSGRTMLALTAAGIPAPAPLLAIEATMAASDPNRGHSAALGAMLAASLPGLLAVAALATALAAEAWFRGRAYGMPLGERAAWAGFVCLFGLQGWVGFRFHRAWPARSACPRCLTHTPRDRPACTSCGEPFPLPEPTGTEIFA